jgi:glycosyltransferase involved in cell wall biosynthesis
MTSSSGAMSSPLLSVIVPVYNERLTVRRLIDRVCAVAIRKEVVIVDDGSTDGSADVIREIVTRYAANPDNKVSAVFQPRNTGKGAAVRAGIAAVTGDIVLIQDADLEYNPDEYPSLIAPILAGHADVVYGSRFSGGTHRVLLFRHAMGNKLLTFISNLFTDLNLTDMETCYKVFRTDVLRRIRLTSNRFGIEPEITSRIAELGCRVYEVPITYHGREYWEGKKIGWRDGVAAVWTMLRCAFTTGVVEDAEGYKTLRRMQRARRYNDWVWTLLAPYVGDRVLEVGAGVGNYTRYLRGRAYVVATDSNPHYLDMLKRQFAEHDHVDVRQTDWNEADLADLRTRRFDTVLCLNVLEHIERDEAALASFNGLLPVGGRLVLQVPAMQGLYGAIDRGLGHWRRYEADELSAKLVAAGFEVEVMRYFNLPGLFAWWLNGVVLKRRAVPGVQSRFVTLTLPWLAFEQRLQLRRGMALMAVARKRREAATAATTWSVTEGDAVEPAVPADAEVAAGR